MERTKSHNVYAKYEPTGEVKRRIIFNGHVDSAYEWTLMKIKQNVMVGVLVVDIVCLLAMIATTVYALWNGPTVRERHTSANLSAVRCTLSVRSVSMMALLA